MSTTVAAAPAITAPASTSRIASIDIIRGAVMVIMAIDHVRVFSGLPAGGPTLGIFFTRWITHFCAPAFIFLAGTSIFFYARKHTDVSRFLIIRGLWLILLELTILRLAWTFNFDFAHYEMAGVIWVIGCCMILMAALVKLPLPVSAAIGALIIAAHNLLDPHIGKLLEGMDGNKLSALWKIGYIGFFAGPVQFGLNGPNLMGALLARPLDRCHGRRLRLRQGAHPRTRPQKTNLPVDRPWSRRSLPAAPRLQSLW